MSGFSELHERLSRRLDEVVAPWSVEVAALLRERALPSLSLVPAREGRAARLGGAALLPESLPWPQTPDRRSLDYLGHLDWGALAQSGSAELGLDLPGRGRCFLFVERLGAASEPVVLRCVHVDDAGPLVEREPPTPACRNESLASLRAVELDAVAALSLPRTQRATSGSLRRARNREADVVLEELEWELRPDEAIGAIGGWANGYQAGKDLYRSLALHDLGKPELVHSDYWDSLEAYESTVRNNPKAKHYVKMRPDVLWLLEHAGAVEERAASWQLLLRIHSNAAMGLQINDSDPLFVFVPRGGPDRFDRAVGRVLQG